jgi:metallo-beta-lactamase class B
MALARTLNYCLEQKHIIIFCHISKSASLNALIISHERERKLAFSPTFFCKKISSQLCFLQKKSYHIHVLILISILFIPNNSNTNYFNIFIFENCIIFPVYKKTCMSKRLSIVASFLLSSIILFTQEQKIAPSLPKLNITALTDGVYVFTTYNFFGDQLFPANGLYAVSDEGTVIIDTPWDTTQFQPLLDSIKQKHQSEVKLVIATHYHNDRTGGLAYYKSKGISTYSSKLTYDLCKEKGENQAQYYFTNDTTFVIGDKKIQTYYPGEGHTKDNIVVWLEDTKVLYGGCFIKSTDSQDLGNVADANLKHWPKSVKKVIKKFNSFKYIIPGHFQWQSTKSAYHTLDLLKMNNRK